MISNRFIKKVPKISELEDKYLATVYDSKCPFSAVGKGLDFENGSDPCLHCTQHEVGMNLWSITSGPGVNIVFSRVSVRNVQNAQFLNFFLYSMFEYL